MNTGTTAEQPDSPGDLKQERHIRPRVVVPSASARAARCANESSARQGSWSRLENAPALRALAPAPRAAVPRARFEVLEQWEGVVEELRAGEFSARLQSTGDREEEVGTFDLAEVAEDDLPLVQPGAVFYWYAGYRVEPHGQKLFTSEIRFRRLPAWSKSDLKRLAVAAEDIDDVFGSASDG